MATATKMKRRQSGLARQREQRDREQHERPGVEQGSRGAAKLGSRDDRGEVDPGERDDDHHPERLEGRRQ